MFNNVIFEIKEESVRHWADKVKNELLLNNDKIGLLVCNAGVMHHPFQLTKDGFETHMQVNYLSHFLLIKELQEVLVGGKVVFTTSSLYKNADPRLVQICLEISQTVF